MGNSTPPHDNLPFNRICLAGVPGQQTYGSCPGQPVTVIDNTDAKTGLTNFTYPYGYNISIPQNITDVFQSGLETMSPTVSSFFDIQWRYYNLVNQEPFDNGSNYAIGVYRQAEMMALNNAIEPVEGLIVDTQNGAVGFRNHSLPPSSPYGSTWSEDLLFVEPETVCVDMNITLDFYLSFSGGGSLGIQMENLVLTDRGGFVNLNRTYPTFDKDNSQSNLDLYGRAYKGAWLSNALSMAFLNVTNPHNGNEPAFSYLNSSIGQEFVMPPAGDAATSVYFSYDAFVTSSTWAGYLGAPLCVNCGGNSTNSTGSSNSTNYPTGNFPNPFGITTKNFTVITELCTGQGTADLANITNVGIMCGLVYGAARRADGSTSLIFEPNTNWTIPLYSCASASRAIIKTVQFLYNGTDGLRNLQVVSVENKQYARDEDMPLWAVENTQMKLPNGLPIWGLVSAANRDLPGISVVQQEALWLPGYTQVLIAGATSGTIDTFDNLPAAEFSSAILSYIYSLDGATQSSFAVAYDYSGKTNLGMFAQWQKDSLYANTTSRILNLIWTDMVANGIMGTRGWLSNPATGGSSSNSNVKRGMASIFKRQASGVDASTFVGVTAYNRVIHYHWLFAIPAAIVVAFVVMIMCATLIFCIIGHARPSYIHRHLYHTSPGRLMTMFLYPNEFNAQSSMKDWSKDVGGKRVDMSEHIPRPMDEVRLGEYEQRHSSPEPLIHKRDVPTISVRAAQT
ncbi:hypothetical protein ZTR_07305 [Talaromyces verruculosus]|nr:hypothetical protein ZTR_07305 [Talaromyces verruculosus]